MAGTKIAEAFVAVSANMAGLSAGMRQGQAITTSAVNSMQRTLGGLQSMLGMIGVGVGFGAIMSKSREAIGLWETQEMASARLGAVIEATGRSAGFSLKQMEDQASALQAVTTHGDEVIMQAQAKLATFRKVTGDEFKRATKAMLDLADTGFGSALTASIQLGRALEDPIRGITALRRAGVSFSEEEKARINQLVEANRLSEAQQLILKAVEIQVGGVAEALAKTDSGKIKQLNNTINDVKEQIGKSLIPVMIRWKETQLAIVTKFESFVSWAAPMIGGFADQWANLNKTTGGLAAKIAVGSAAMLTLLPLIGMAGRAFAMMFPVGLLGALASPFGLVAGAIVGGLALWTRYSETGKKALDSVTKAFGPVLNVAKDTFGGIKDALTSGDIGLAGQIAITSLQTAFYSGLASINEKTGGFISTFITYWSTAFQSISEGWIRMQSSISQNIIKLAKEISDTDSTFGKIVNVLLTIAGPAGWAAKKQLKELGDEWKDMQAESDGIAEEGNKVRQRDLAYVVENIKTKIAIAESPEKKAEAEKRRTEITGEIEANKGPGENELAGTRLLRDELQKQFENLTPKLGERMLDPALYKQVEGELDKINQQIAEAETKTAARNRLSAELRNLDEALAGAANPEELAKWRKELEAMNADLADAKKGPVKVDVADEAVKGIQAQTEKDIAETKAAIEQVTKNILDGVEGAKEKAAELKLKLQGLNALAELGSDITGVLGTLKEGLSKAGEAETVDAQVAAIQAARNAAFDQLDKEYMEAVTQGADKNAIAKKAEETRGKVAEMLDEAMKAVAKRREMEGKETDDGTEKGGAATGKASDPFVGFAELNRKMQEAMLKDTVASDALDVAKDQRDLLQKIADGFGATKQGAVNMLGQGLASAGANAFAASPIAGGLGEVGKFGSALVDSLFKTTQPPTAPGQQGDGNKETVSVLDKIRVIMDTVAKNTAEKPKTILAGA